MVFLNSASSQNHLYEESNNITFDHFPDEMIVEIFSHLTLQGLLTASLVCKRWKILHEETSLWGKIFSSPFGKSKLEYKLELALFKEWKKVCSLDNLYNQIFYQRMNDMQARAKMVQSCIDHESLAIPPSLKHNVNPLKEKRPRKRQKV